MNRFEELPNFWHLLHEIYLAISIDQDFPSGLTIMLMVMLTAHGMTVLFITISFHKLVENI